MLCTCRWSRTSLKSWRRWGTVQIDWKPLLSTILMWQPCIRTLFSPIDFRYGDLTWLSYVRAELEAYDACSIVVLVELPCLGLKNVQSVVIFVRMCRLIMYRFYCSYHPTQWHFTVFIVLRSDIDMFFFAAMPVMCPKNELAGMFYSSLQQL